LFLFNQYVIKLIRAFTTYSGDTWLNENKVDPGPVWNNHEGHAFK
jgi:hypothetical protein